MGSSSSKSSSVSGGNGEWTAKLYFDPEADKSCGAAYHIEDGELRAKMKEVIDSTERIIRVEIYRHPLYSFQLTDALMYHSFVVFETDDWWWSIEKNSEGLTIQRSKYKSSVLNEYRRENRVGLWSSVSFVMSAESRKTIGDLVDFLYLKNHLNKKYDFLVWNCKHFAAAVYNELRSTGRDCIVGVQGLVVFADLP